MEIEYNFTCFVNITVKDRQGGLGTVLEYLQWNGLPFDVRQKWDWYFKYRAALLQVKYPRGIVDMRWGNEPKADKEAIDRKNAIASKRRTITKTKNALADGEAILEQKRREWVELFPIDDTVEYRQALQILDKYRAKIARLEIELEHIT